MKRILMSLSATAMIATGAAAANLSIDKSEISSNGTTVTVPGVDIDKPGFVVIHAMENGKPVEPGSIGHTYVDKGMNESVKVTTDMPLASGEQYIAMLHYDTDGDQKYSFGKGSTDVDTPAMDSNGKPYEVTFTAK